MGDPLKTFGSSNHEAGSKAASGLPKVMSKQRLMATERELPSPIANWAALNLGAPTHLWMAFSLFKWVGFSNNSEKLRKKIMTRQLLKFTIVLQLHGKQFSDFHLPSHKFHYKRKLSCPNLLTFSFSSKTVHFSLICKGIVRDVRIMHLDCVPPIVRIWSHGRRTKFDLHSWSMRPFTTFSTYYSTFNVSRLQFTQDTFLISWKGMCGRTLLLNC